MQGGEMFFHIQKSRFSEEKTKFYIAELVLALDFLHQNKTVYRDLKPENILIDAAGHIKITDFGLSKILTEDEIAQTLCGTPQYLAPEILTKNYEYSVDWFSLGCVMYMMLFKRPVIKLPKGQSPSIEMYKKVLIPPKLNKPVVVSNEAINFLRALLQIEPKDRLGYDGVDKIKKHPFFKSIDWNLLEKRKVTPPFIPELNDEYDLRYFDKVFTNEPINNDVFGIDKNFKPESGSYTNFTYVTDSVGNELININEDEDEPNND